MSEIENALAALKAGGHQYVAPGLTPPSGVSVKEGDHIFLVVLPAEVKETPQEIARTLDNATQGKYVFAVVRGDEAAGYSTLLRGNTAEDLFSKAQDITNSPQVAMGVFSTLVHRYQDTPAGREDMAKLTVTTTEVPKAPPSEPSAAPYMVGGSLALVFAVAVTVFKVMQNKAARKYAETPDRERTYSKLDLRNWVEVTNTRDLPPKAASLLSEIKSDVADIADHWEKVQGTEIGGEVQDICFNLIPKNLELYRSLPGDMRRSKVKSMGVVPDELIVESLTAIEEGLARTREAAFEGSVRDLTVEAIFAKSKYHGSTLEL